MPYQYEYDKSLKVYSITIDLEMIGKDENFKTEASSEEKAARVIALLDAIANLSLVVRGNLDNAEPIFVAGGMSEKKTHYFENVVRVKNEELLLPADLIDKLGEGYACGLLQSGIFANEVAIIKELNPRSIKGFFEEVKDKVRKYYSV